MYTYGWFTLLLAETKTTLESNYSLIKNKIRFKKEVSNHSIFFIAVNKSFLLRNGNEL